MGSLSAVLQETTKLMLHFSRFSVCEVPDKFIKAEFVCRYMCFASALIMCVIIIIATIMYIMQSIGVCIYVATGLQVI